MEELSIETVAAMLIDRFSSVELTEDTSVLDRNVAISLYYLFKDTFLLALDLLDEKRIIACYWEPAFNQQLQSQRQIYYVFDAVDDQDTTSIFKKNQKHQYEVRTSAWYCSCPEFIFSAFNNDYDITWDRTIMIPGGFWGGCILGHPIPICKHLLACVLIGRGLWIRRNVLEKLISKEELIFRSIQ
ncbi:hypothetical protein PMAC_002916 [Pneumocystis sp. 'macacae']|nr:hypothetical protein PMAC_002916 [Pneumocystis sp. 'macacae']